MMPPPLAVAESFARVTFVKVKTPPASIGDAAARQSAALPVTTRLLAVNAPALSIPPPEPVARPPVIVSPVMVAVVLLATVSTPDGVIARERQHVRSEADDRLGLARAGQADRTARKRDRLRRRELAQAVELDRVGSGVERIRGVGIRADVGPCGCRSQRSDRAGVGSRNHQIRRGGFVRTDIDRRDQH